MTGLTEADYEAQIKLAEQTAADAILESGGGIVKVAQELYSTYIQDEIIEDSFWRKIIPVEPAEGKLTPSAYHDENEVIVEIEGKSLASMIVPFDTSTRVAIPKARKAVVRFAYNMTPQLQVNVDRIRHWQHDIRSVVSDKMVRAMGGVEDYHFVLSMNTMLVGPGVVMPSSGVAQWTEVSGGYSRQSLRAAVFDPLASRPNELATETVMMNRLTAARIAAAGPETWGGPVAQDTLQDGLGDKKLFGTTKAVITRKKGLVPVGTIFSFPDPKYTGRSYELYAPVMHVERKAMNVKWFAYGLIGGVINDNLARCDIRD